MAYVEKFALTDVALVELTTTETTPETYYFATSSECEGECEVNEGDETVLRVKDTIYAVNKRADLVVGYNIKLVDNMLAPEVFALIDGGTATKDTEAGKWTYTAPLAGAAVVRKTFTCNIYTHIMDGKTITGYLKCSYPGCTGKPVKPVSKDGEFYAPELNILSRPASGEAPMTWTQVAELPEVSA